MAGAVVVGETPEEETGQNQDRVSRAAYVTSPCMCVSLECIRITHQSHCQFDQTWHDHHHRPLPLW